MPERIQLRRAKGWRKPAGAVVVSRPSRWGNPFPFAGSGDRAAQRARVVHQFRRELLAGRLPDYPSLDEIREHLAGRDLACWCPLDQPCHADVLLEIANSEP